MSKQTYKLSKKELKGIIEEVIRKTLVKKPLCDYYSYLPKINEENVKFKKVNKDVYEQCIVLNEALNKTYPTNITLRYVYNIMDDPYIEFQIPDESDEQNDTEIANHIIVSYLPNEDLQTNLSYLKKLTQAFNLCGYIKAASSVKDEAIGKVICIQFEPKYQNEVNKQLTRFIYHVTTKNKLNNILRNGFVPKNACVIGLNYDRRCHFFLDVINLDEVVNSYIEQCGKTNKEFKNNNLIENEEFVIIQIDTTRIQGNIKFYPDPNFPKGIAVFTYANIHSNTIVKYFNF